MSYHHTIQDIHKATGLTANFIRRCAWEMKEVFDQHTTRGENNTILFDNNALSIFDQIKQLKEQGLTIPKIQEKLDYKPLKPCKTDSKSAYETLLNQVVKPLEPEMQDFSFQFYEPLLEEKEKTHKAELEAKSYQIQLEEKEKVYKTHLQAKQVEIEAIKSKLQVLTDGRDPEEVKRAEEEKRRQKVEILNRLEDLEGRWFKGNERKELIKRLRELDGVA